MKIFDSGERRTTNLLWHLWYIFLGLGGRMECTLIAMYHMTIATRTRSFFPFAPLKFDWLF